MKRYHRFIGDTIVCVLVEEYIFKRCAKKIKSILGSFSDSSFSIGENQTVNCFFIIQEKNKNNYPYQNTYAIRNIDDECWMLELINDLEVFYADILKCTVLHGSCLSLNGKNFLLLGERWCGKTTLTYYLTVEQGAEYVSDDCVYIKNKQYYGFCTPLPIRNFNNRNPEINKNILASVVDGEEVSRTLLLPSKVLNNVSDIDVVLFPKYHSDVKSEITKISSSKMFKAIMNNVRFFGSMQDVYGDVKDLANKAKAYLMTYSSSSSAYKILMDCISEI